MNKSVVLRISNLLVKISSFANGFNEKIKLQEGWSLVDSMYYTFITLSTIGFGDFVALQNESKDLQVHTQNYFHEFTEPYYCFHIT